MSKKISAIKDDVVHRICSSQVILNLATAVKELIENSLDAGATSIEIRLKEYGSELIEVSDNGKGIHPDDFEALALKHHTSKLSDFSDLINVETFGFRGEALSSLCALGELVVKTRHESEKCGSKLIFDRMGVLQANEPYPRQAGTTVSLTNLFKSLPVRQKEFLRNLKKEFVKTTQLLSAYCLIATNVKITCVNQTKKGGKTTFLSTHENKTIRDNISCIFGPKQLANLLEIKTMEPSLEILNEFGIGDFSISLEDFSLEGLISSCRHGCGRSSCDRQFYYINSRPCDPVKIVKLTNEVYHRYNQHQFPFVILNVVVPKKSIDINVTPDKRLIFLENEKLLLALIENSLVKMFENIPSTYKINTPVSLIMTNVTEKSENEVDKIDKSSLLKLNKLRHFSDNNCQRNEAVNVKRRNIECSQNSACDKQLKLDQLFAKKAKKCSSRIDNTLNNIREVTSVEFSDIFKPVSSEEQFVTVEPSALVCKEEVTDTIIATSTEQVALRKAKETDETENKQKENEQSVMVNDEEPVTTVEFSQNINAPMADVSNVIPRDFTSTSDTLIETLSKKSADQAHVITAKRKITDTVIMESGYTLNDDVIFDNTECIQTHEPRKIMATIEINISSLRESLRRRRKNDNLDAIFLNKFHAEINPAKNEVAEEELQREISKNMFSEMKIIGQFNLGFIIARLGNDLFIIDQHASDEKYNFETLQRTTSLKSQKLVIPQDLNLTAMNECILIDNIDVLNKNGFEFCIDMNAEPTKKVKLTSIPVSQNWQFGKSDIDELLFMLQDSPNTLCRPSRVRAMFASRACRKSVMIGTPLSINDMRTLVNNMGTIKQPWNCPHGRPTMRHLINLSLLH